MVLEPLKGREVEGNHPILVMIPPQVHLVTMLALIDQQLAGGCFVTTHLRRSC